MAFVDGYMDLDWDGRVDEIDPAVMKVLRVLDRKIRFTNGIAFGPDNRLYASASFTVDMTCLARQCRSGSSSATCCSRIPTRMSKGRTGGPLAWTAGSIARSTTRRTSPCWIGGAKWSIG
ncbi:hypothetical protein [Bradyrhizobium niftali]|jgi:hypothetical protein|uniref:hypothetical protein n=1 Tax=Bradyrhizobium niftali TaxID=2560055 RepID=UPI001F270B0B|nr:hypothetical protein [Bradyrhizobium niftali]